MTKHRSSRSRSSSRSQGGTYSRTGRKTEAEARVERTTWFLLVLIFAAINFLPEGTIPNAWVPFGGALVILGSALYQYSRHWYVSPVTWIVGSVMLMLGLYSMYVDPGANLLSISLIAFAVVIGFGVLTGET